MFHQVGENILRLGLIIALLLFAAPASAEKLFLAAEYYPPYNLRDESGQPSGAYMEQVRIILKRSHIRYEAAIMPWARAVALAENRPMNCAFAAARTPEREKRFKWVSPLYIDRNVLVARRNAHLQVADLNEAKNYTIGTQRNDYTETMLRSMGFPRIDVSADFNKSLAKLAAGRIDMMPMSESALKNLPDGEFEEVILFSRQSLGLACNISVPDALIGKMQQALDQLIADGTQRRIFENHDLVIRDRAFGKTSR